MSESAPETLPVGTTLNDTYRLTRLLGIGGMGAVYEGVHMSAGKRVAIKVMWRGLMAYPDLHARFRREAKVTSELSHPNIVGVYGFGEAAGGEPYLVMEYLEGEDLQARLEREGALSPEETADIVTQLAAGLSVAHAEGVVHRDLKPSNVFLVRRADNSVFVKVVDFGISKVLKRSATKLTVARAVFGTPEFMAPEQAAGQQDRIDHRSDQWSLACIAWFTMTARLPFSQPEVDGTLNQVMSAIPTPLPEGRVSAEVEQVLRKALSKRRSERFPTIKAFARAFDAAVRGLPVRAGTPPRPLDSVARNATPAPARSQAAELTPSPRAVPAGRPVPPAEPGRRGRARSGHSRWVVVGVVLAALAAAWQFRDQPPLAGLWNRATQVLERR